VRRARGFSLIELLISLALAGVVVGGALQLHVAYNSQAARQRQIADVQQSLRVSMQIMERAIRGAGSGMITPVSNPPPATQYTAGVMTCGAAATRIYGFQYWNGNTWPPVQTVAPVVDADPDYFKVIAAQPENVTAATYDSAAGAATLVGPIAGWKPNDLVLFLTTHPTPAVGSGLPVSCLRTVTGVAGQVATFAAPGVPACNVVGGAGDCLNGAGISPPPYVAGASGGDTVVKHFVNETVFRVALPPANSNDTPKLMLRQAPINDTTVNYPWMPIADNIEDMQIAMIMSNGDICNSVDNPASAAPNCDPTQALAVRITLVARSTTTMAGNPPAPKGGFEDEPVTQAPNDGFLRRSMTTEINLRN
jgi:prepilin-type N-terminal cleavage/methylation domain-containing protein